MINRKECLECLVFSYHMRLRLDWWLLIAKFN